MWWLYSHLPLSMCVAEKLKTVATHTHTHTRPPEGSFLPNTSAPVTCQFKVNTDFPLVLPPINHMCPILRQLEPRVSNWSGYKLVSACACVYTGKQGSLCLTTCNISAAERWGRAQSCRKKTALRAQRAEVLLVTCNFYKN